MGCEAALEGALDDFLGGFLEKGIDSRVEAVCQVGGGAIQEPLVNLCAG